MVLTLATALSLAAQCAPDVAPDVLLSVAHVESHFDPYAVDINHGPIVHPRSLDEAVAVASRYIRAGYSVDMGVVQINSHNLERLGLTIADTFDPCTNMRAAQRLLLENYDRARHQASGDTALGLAFSYYNSGSATVGYHNGYVGKVFKAAQQITPAVHTMAFSTDGMPSSPEGAPSADPITAPMTASSAQPMPAASPPAGQGWLITGSGVPLETAPLTTDDGVMIFK